VTSIGRGALRVACWCDVLALLTLAVVLLSIHWPFGLALRRALVELNGGQMAILWQDTPVDDVWGGIEFCELEFAPQFSWRLPPWEYAGPFSAVRTCAYFWVLNIPLWLPLGATLVPAILLRVLVRRVDARGRGLRGLLWRVLGLSGGIVGGLLVAFAVGVVAAKFSETQPWRDILTRVIVPLVAGTVAGVWAARRILAMCPWVGDAGHCANCGYDLTGNVSGLCPECGTATAADGR